MEVWYEPARFPLEETHPVGIVHSLLISTCMIFQPPRAGRDGPHHVRRLHPPHDRAGAQRAVRHQRAVLLPQRRPLADQSQHR